MNLFYLFILVYLTLNKNKILNYNFLKISTSADSILHFFDFPIQFEIENRKSSTPHKYSRIYNKNTIVVQPILGRIPMMFSICESHIKKIFSAFRRWDLNSRRKIFAYFVQYRIKHENISSVFNSLQRSARVLSSFLLDHVLFSTISIFE